METNQTNQQAIRRAIYNIGGATLASSKLDVTPSAIYKWIEKGSITRLDKAEKVAELSGFQVNILRPIYEQ